MPDQPLEVRFWGVRGSTPTPQTENLKFGGNTSCVEIRTPEGECIIFDAGSGIRGLGKSRWQEAGDQQFHTNIFLTHFHWDHIQGLPFFEPLYGSKNSVTFHSGRTALREALEGQMSRPYFPVDLAQVSARCNFIEMKSGAAVGIGEAAIRPFELNHPQGASGYRIECGKSVVVYATDFEHGHPELDAVLLAHAQDADILICDAQYSPQEYDAHRGRGHGTWLNATSLARAAGAKQLILFHHDPDHDDDTMERIQMEARNEFANTAAAWEGLRARLP